MKRVGRRISHGAALRALAVACLVGASAAGRAQTEGEAPPFRVALTGKYPPFSYYDDQGELVGFDVEVSREVARRLGRDLELLAIEWDGILTGLLQIMQARTLLGPTSQQVALMRLEPLRWLAVPVGVALLLLILQAGTRAPSEFIYFQF